MTPTREQVAAVLEDSATDLETFGRRRYNYGALGHPKCVLGAINTAVFGNPIGHAHAQSGNLARVPLTLRDDLSLRDALALFDAAAQAVVRRLDPEHWRGTHADPEYVEQNYGFFDPDTTRAATRNAIVGWADTEARDDVVIAQLRLAAEAERTEAG